MMYQSEKMYVKVQREVIRESFTMYASRSMIESSGGIDALISNYASTPTQISNSSGNLTYDNLVDQAGTMRVAVTYKIA